MASFAPAPLATPMQGATAFPPAPAPDCVERERCQHISLCASLIRFQLSPAYEPVLLTAACLFSMNSLPNVCAFCKFCCSLVQHYFPPLFSYLDYRMAYDESTAL